MFGRLINDSSSFMYGRTASTFVPAGTPHTQQIFENCNLLLSGKYMFTHFTFKIVMSDIDFFTDTRYPDIVQLLISDTDINRYRIFGCGIN